MIFELSSQVLKCRPVKGEEISTPAEDWTNLELAVVKKFENFSTVHLEVDSAEFGIYQLHIQINTELTNVPVAIDQLKYAVEQLTSFVSRCGFEVK